MPRLTCNKPSFHLTCYRWLLGGDRTKGVAPALCNLHLQRWQQPPRTTLKRPLNLARNRIEKRVYLFPLRTVFYRALNETSTET